MIFFKKTVLAWVAISLFFSAFEATQVLAGGFEKNLFHDIQEVAPSIGMDFKGRVKELISALQVFEIRELNLPKFSVISRLGKSAHLLGLYLMQPQSSVFKEKPSHPVLAASAAILGGAAQIADPSALRVVNDVFSKTGSSVEEVLDQMSRADLLDEMLTGPDLTDEEEDRIIESAARSIAVFETIALLFESQGKAQDKIQRHLDQSESSPTGLKSQLIGNGDFTSEPLSIYPYKCKLLMTMGQKDPVEFDLKTATDESYAGEVLEFESRANQIMSDFKYDILFQILASMRVVRLGSPRRAECIEVGHSSINVPQGETLATDAE